MRTRDKSHVYDQSNLAECESSEEFMDKPGAELIAKPEAVRPIAHGVLSKINKHDGREAPLPQKLARRCKGGKSREDNIACMNWNAAKSEPCEHVARRMSLVNR